MCARMQARLMLALLLAPAALWLLLLLVLPHLELGILEQSCIQCIRRGRATLLCAALKLKQ